MDSPAPTPIPSINLPTRRAPNVVATANRRDPTKKNPEPTASVRVRPNLSEIDRLNIVPSTAMTFREPIRISVSHSVSPKFSFAMKNAPPLTPIS